MTKLRQLAYMTCTRGSFHPPWEGEGGNFGGYYVEGCNLFSLSVSVCVCMCLCDLWWSFHSASLSLRMESTSSVPEVAKNVEVVSNNDLALERELARSDNATLMKRTISDDESGEEEEETGRKIPKVTKERGMYESGSSFFFLSCTILLTSTVFSYIYDVVCTVPAQVSDPQEETSNIAMGVGAFPWMLVVLSGVLYL